MVETFVSVEESNISRERLEDFFDNNLALKAAIKRKYLQEFPELVPNSPHNITGENYHFLQVENPVRAQKYANRNVEILEEGHVGFEAIRSKMADMSFFALKPTEYLGRTGNFAVAINTAPYTLDSAMLIPIKGLAKSPAVEYYQNLAEIDPAILQEVQDFTRDGVFSAFMNNAVNSQRRMHFCIMANEHEIDDLGVKQLPLAEALAREDGGYNDEGVSLYYPPEDARSIRLNAMVFDDSMQVINMVKKLEQKGVLSDVLISQGKICLVAYRNDQCPVVLLPDGTPWLPSGERLGFNLETPNYQRTDDPEENDRYIRGLYDAFNSKVYTNKEIRKLIDGDEFEFFEV